MALMAFGRRLLGRGGAALVLVTLPAVLLSACSVVQGAFAPPLPPAETLQLQARLVPGGGMAGALTVRISWLPPEGSADIVVVIEQAETPEGPWEEIKARRSDRGFHEETSIYRPGRFYYFRAFLVRGNQETVPGSPVELWVPSEGPIPTPTPRPTSTPRPTATPAG